MRIPTPPVKVQREIVSILDKFTQLEAELKAELETRQRQFAEYSDQLLSDLGLDNASVPFGEVATIKRGASPRPISQFISDGEGAVPWIKIGDVSQGSKFITKTKEKVSQEGAAKSRVIQPGDFLLSNSMSFGRPYISKISGCIHDGWLSISEFEEHLDSDFLFHILNSNRIQSEFRRRAGSGTVKNLNAEIVKNVSLPLPPLSLQRQIARALDTFERFTSDSSDGLPAEIAARRKQYEYYRNKLLTFKELDAA
jgi:type I restriction enzyme S subunit